MLVEIVLISPEADFEALINCLFHKFLTGIAVLLS